VSDSRHSETPAQCEHPDSTAASVYEYTYTQIHDRGATPWRLRTSFERRVHHDAHTELMSALYQQGGTGRLVCTKHDSPCGDGQEGCHASEYIFKFIIWSRDWHVLAYTDISAAINAAIMGAGRCHHRIRIQHHTCRNSNPGRHTAKVPEANIFPPDVGTQERQ
jgi:hypothetical protein